jgi:PAS domain S-box-containing protein
MSRLKILHLEDSSSDAELVRRLLKKNSFEFDRLLVDTKEEFLSALKMFVPDIILSDHSLPSFNSHEALEIVKAANLDIPFILITANVSEEFAVDVIGKGADDYILKDRLQRLPSAIHNALDKHRFKRERQEFINNVIKNEKRFRALIENSSDGIAVLSETGKPTYVSPSIKNILGYSYQEVLGLNLLAIVHPEDLIVLEQLIQKALINPGIAFKGAPTRMIHRNGGWLWIEHVLTNMLHDSSINGIVDNFRDTTERIQFEQVMQESEEKYRSFYENSMDGILLTVTDGAILAANPAACAIFQMTEKEICLKGRMGLVDQEDPRLARVLKERQLTGRTSGQVTFIRKDGSKFPGEVTGAVFMDVAGNKRTSMIIRDISARIEAEADALKASEEKTEILESIRDAFFAVDEHWVVTYWNKESEKLLECSREHIIGKKLESIFEDHGDNLFFSNYRKALKRNEIQNFEAFYEKTNSWFNVTAYPSVHGLSVYLKDVTERKLADLQVIKLNQDLHKYTKELVISNTELEQFSYIISHNLRAPVAKKMLNDSLMASVNLLNNVIVDLNTILKVKKEISEKREMVNFTDLVNDIKVSIKNIIATEQVEVKIDFILANELLTLKSYIHSIFYNLISNSIKYRQAEHTPVIEISSCKKDGNLIITFKDNGIGIDMSKRKDQVFGLYKRFHQHVEGKGMGLFMVKTQVETMKGKISVESIVNEHTVFTISLPIS